jgi:hypothetical protein
MTSLTICVSFCVAALFQHCFSASVFAFVLQQFALVLRQFTFVVQRVSASVLQKQSIAINDNLDHLRHLCCSHISNKICDPQISKFHILFPYLFRTGNKFIIIGLSFPRRFGSVGNWSFLWLTMLPYSRLLCFLHFQLQSAKQIVSFHAHTFYCTFIMSSQTIS